MSVHCVYVEALTAFNSRLILSVQYSSWQICQHREGFTKHPIAQIMYDATFSHHNQPDCWYNLLLSSLP